ncbi:unnamed protein product [Allacma fusca]|uniref:Uncharacterized protein n=1 Tax=Allacma fusca TaxID=39272 RepID=A0A8J2KI58_9HEXA|nr:unnamed protein product [Allacma fusca]
MHFTLRLKALVLLVGTWIPSAQAGVPIPGLESGPTPFQTLFATGFSGSYNTFGTGTTAGAIGAYGRFVSGGANSDTHGTGGGGYGK